jgi:hypothetical protein
MSKDIRRVASKLEDHGRYGDTLVAHINPREALMLALMGGAATKNPKTGLLEFYDSSYDGGGAGNQDNSIGGGFASDATGGGGVTTPGEQLADAIARGDQIDFSTQAAVGGVDPWAGTLGGQVGDRAMPSYADTRGFLGGVRDNVQAGLQDMAARPGEAIANTVLGLAVPGYSVANTLVGLAAPGNTIAGLGIGAAKGGINQQYMGADDTPGAAPGGDKGSPLNDGTRGGEGRDPASGSGGPISQPQNALVNALMGNTPLNTGRKTFGAPVDSFDPNGRRYVTPWAYRG